jgi:hypothetical protein
MTAEHLRTPRRQVRLVIVSSTHTPGELSDHLGMRADASSAADETGRNSSARESAWELHESGTDGSDITDLIESLHARALPLAERLITLKDAGAKIILRFVLYLSPGDDWGAGFVIDRSELEWIEALGIEFIDVAQYIFS